MDSWFNFLSGLTLAQLLLWACVVGVALGALALGGWSLVRLRVRRSSVAGTSSSWEELVAVLHDRLDQCELLLKQFGQRADKQHQELREAVAHLQTSVEALEKPFSAVSARFGQLGQGKNLGGPL